MADTKLKTLLVGVGGRGSWPLDACDDASGFQITALCDPNAEFMAAAQGRDGYGGAACFEDYDQAIAEADVDCAILCVPTIFHVPFIKKAVDRGLPVLCEKGMAPDWETACDGAAYVAANNGVVCISQNYRYNSLERTVQRVLTDAAHPAHVGAPFAVDLLHQRVRPVPRTLNYPFASVWDMSCHHMDTLLFWFGPVARLRAHAYGASWSPYEHPSNTCVHLEFQNGVRVNYTHGHDAGRGIYVFGLHGERGSLSRVLMDDTEKVPGAEGLTFNTRPAEQFGQREAVPVEVVSGDGERGVLADFCAYIRDGKEPGISMQQNLEVMAMCQMIVVSATEGRTVERSELGDAQ